MRPALLKLREALQTQQITVIGGVLSTVIFDPLQLLMGRLRSQLLTATRKQRPD